MLCIPFLFLRMDEHKLVFLRHRLVKLDCEINWETFNQNFKQLTG